MNIVNEFEVVDVIIGVYEKFGWLVEGILIGRSVLVCYELCDVIYELLYKWLIDFDKCLDKFEVVVLESDVD